MLRRTTCFLAAGVLTLAGAGCNNDTPHDYGVQRPDANQLAPEDRGLQSKDVEACASQVVSDLLANPQLNSSPTQWTLVISDMQDMTSEHLFNYNIFIEAMRSAISHQATGRIQLIENKDTFNNLRNKELDPGPNPDPYGQGGGATTTPPPAINPDYIMYGKAMDLPNASTDFYLLQFNIVNSRNRTQPWTGEYKVKTKR